MLNSGLYKRGSSNKAFTGQKSLSQEKVKKQIPNGEEKILKAKETKQARKSTSVKSTRKNLSSRILNSMASNIIDIKKMNLDNRLLSQVCNVNTDKSRSIQYTQSTSAGQKNLDLYNQFKYLQDKKRVRQQNEKLKREKDDMESCTFQPKCNSRKAPGERVSNLGVYKRNLEWKNKKAMEITNIKTQMNDPDCTFKPDINQLRVLSDTMESDYQLEKQKFLCTLRKKKLEQCYQKNQEKKSIMERGYTYYHLTAVQKNTENTILTISNKSLEATKLHLRRSLQDAKLNNYQ